MGFSEFRCAHKFASWTAILKNRISTIFEIRIVEKYNLHCSNIFSGICSSIFWLPLSMLLLGGAVCPGVWESASPRFWESGSLGVWESESLGVCEFESLKSVRALPAQRRGGSWLRRLRLLSFAFEESI